MHSFELKFPQSSLVLVTILILSISVGCKGQEPSGQIEQERVTKVIPQSPLDPELNQTINGLKEGLWKKYHANGQLKSEGSYAAGKKQGLHISWDEEGILTEEAMFSNGKENGLTKWFHPEGHLAGSGNMVDGIRHGPWKICDIAPGGFCIDANFKDGKRDGVWKIYHDATNAEVWKEQTFENDRIVSERCWDKAGTSIPCK